MADPTPPTPPAPTPPDAPAFSKAWWLKQLQLILPTNWRQMIQWLIVFAFAYLVHRLTGESIPVPEPPLPAFDAVMTEDGRFDDATLQEMSRRGVRVHRAGWIPPKGEENFQVIGLDGKFHSGGWSPPDANERLATLMALEIAKFSDTEAGHQAIVADTDYPVWRLATKGRGRPIPDRDQGQIGSCVSFGFSTAPEYTMAAQAAIGKQRQELPDLANEPVYGGSRVNVNGGRSPGGEGSTGAWAAKWLETVGGVLPRAKYPSVDLTTYSVSLCRSWGDRGVPADIVPLCLKHGAKCTLVQSSQEAKVALSQGYAIAVCSNIGFQSMTRNADGFISPSGSWPHCMSIIGYRADKSGFLIENSWGSGWCKGPKGTFADIPDGSFWVDEKTVDGMLKQGDSYAVANAEGFRRRKVLPDDWVVSVPKARQLFEPFFALAP